MVPAPVEGGAGQGEGQGFTAEPKGAGGSFTWCPEPGPVASGKLNLVSGFLWLRGACTLRLPELSVLDLLDLPGDV